MWWVMEKAMYWFQKWEKVQVVRWGRVSRRVLMDTFNV